jgi:hypothetical protein
MAANISKFIFTVPELHAASHHSNRTARFRSEQVGVSVKL